MAEIKSVFKDVDESFPQKSNKKQTLTLSCRPTENRPGNVLLFFFLFHSITKPVKLFQLSPWVRKKSGHELNELNFKVGFLIVSCRPSTDAL